MASVAIAVVTSCSIDNRILARGGDDGASGDATARVIQAPDGGDGGAVYGCTASNTVVAPPSGVISDLVDDSYLVTYSAPTMMGAPTYTAAGGALHITVNQAPDSGQQFLGVVFGFQGCVDASAFAGVEFTISGAVKECTMQYSTNYSADSSIAFNQTGLCSVPTCFSPKILVTPTPVPTVVQIPWKTSSYEPGHPVPNPDAPATLLGVQWEFAIPAASDASNDSCLADVTITDLKFYD